MVFLEQDSYIHTFLRRMSDTKTSLNINLSSWDTLYTVYMVDIYSTGPYVHEWHSHTLYRVRFSHLTLRKYAV